MNSNLENEYKKMINSQVPDLWDRIESSLPEKGNNVVTFNPISNNENVDVNNRTIKLDKKTKKSKAKLVAVISSAMVACIATLVVIPVLFNTNEASKSKCNSVAYGRAKYEVEYDGVAECAECETDEETTHAAGAKKEVCYDEPDSKNYKQTMKYAAESMPGTDSNDSVEMNNEKSSENNVADSTHDMATDNTFTVTITCRNEDEEGEVFYNATVVSGTQNGTSLAGQNIIIYSSGSEFDNISSGQQVTVNLKFVEVNAEGIAAYSF